MKLIIFLIPFVLFAEDFISNLEYGKMLYENPRGIGCIKCHGNDAKGKIIATYKDNNKTIKVIAPNIKTISWEVFYKRVKYSKILKNSKFRTLNYSYMPRYDYLVDHEIEAIYTYIKALK